jgi:hypothetical protein
LTVAGQPFSFAGDTTLTAVRDNSGKYFVKVDRLYGNEVNEFTMVNVKKGFPADPPADTPKLGAQVLLWLLFPVKIPSFPLFPFSP